MSRDIKSADGWSGEFDQIRESIEKSRSVMEGFAKWIWDNVVAKDVIPPRMPSEVSHGLAALDQELRAIAHSNDNLRWYFCRNPLDKWLTGQQLTREEFYLLAAQGILKIPSETGSEEAYEEFTNDLYEDNELRGYINPSERPELNGGWTPRLKIGIVPEDVRKSFLSAHQKAFFRKFKPILFSRFRND